MEKQLDEEVGYYRLVSIKRLLRSHQKTMKAPQPLSPCQGLSSKINV